jgi:uncharacterized protein YbjT (DUF2867 family)
MNMPKQRPIPVLGGTGKTGRRIVQRLQARGVPVRVGTRSASPPFDWTDEGSWPAALFTEVLDGRNAYLTDGVHRALSRSPRDFADYARDTAATGVSDS